MTILVPLIFYINFRISLISTKKYTGILLGIILGRTVILITLSPNPWTWYLHLFKSLISHSNTYLVLSAQTFYIFLKFIPKYFLFFWSYWKWYYYFNSNFQLLIVSVWKYNYFCISTLYLVTLLNSLIVLVTFLTDFSGFSTAVTRSLESAQILVSKYYFP